MEASRSGPPDGRRVFNGHRVDTMALARWLAVVLWAPLVLAACGDGSDPAVAVRGVEAGAPASTAVPYAASPTVESTSPTPPTSSAATTIPAPTTTTPPPPPVRVAIIGDSMFAFGKAAVEAEVNGRAELEIVEYVYESGTTTYTNSRLQPVIDSVPDALVVSFQLNDTFRLGQEAATEGYRNLLERARSVPCVRWVTFLPEEPFGYAVDVLARMVEDFPNAEVIPFNEELEAHPEWRLPAETAFGGDIHLHPDGGGPPVLGRMIADSLVDAGCVG